MSLQLPFGGREILDDALETWGVEAQKNMAIEEFAEAILALVRMSRGRTTQEEILGELADAFIMASQMAIFHGESLVQEKINFKMDRLKKRLEAYHNPFNSEGVKAV